MTTKEEKGQQSEARMLTVTYDLYVDWDGEETLVEECDAARPFRFVTGTGFVFEAFEAALLAKAAGEAFDITVTAEEANGPRDEELVVEVSKGIFCPDGGAFPKDDVYKGAMVPLTDGDGNHLQATVVAIGRESVTIDLNHPLAGKDLHFKGRVVENRLATKEELERATRGCGGCGKGCGDKGEGCKGGGCDTKGCC